MGAHLTKTISTIIREAMENLGGKASIKEVVNYLKSRYPNIKEGAISTSMSDLSVNGPPSSTYSMSQRFLFRIERGKYALHEPKELHDTIKHESTKIDAKSQDIEIILKRFRWETLSRMYGLAHSSIIGFISTEWINQSADNSILDGAPSSITGKGRIGQKNADILLCKGNKPLIVVEVETTVNKYDDKINAMLSYLKNRDNFSGIEFGLLFMANHGDGARNYKHSWEPAKQKIRNTTHNIAFVSIEKKKSSLSDSNLDKLRKRNEYSPWEIITVDYWIHDSNGIEKDGNLWSVNEDVVMKNG